MDTQTFLTDLASGAPTPGGGGASAYCGALATALASMVGNLTVGKERYRDVEPQVLEALGELEGLREELVSLIAADAEAFGTLAASWRMPSATEAEKAAKHAAGQRALEGACEVPLRIMGACAKAVVLSSFMAQNGSRLALSDAGVAAVLAQAGMEGASLNILINAKSFDDEALAAGYLEKARTLLDRYTPLARETYDQVRRQVAQ